MIPLLLIFSITPGWTDAEGLRCESLQFKQTGFDTVWVDLTDRSLQLFWKHPDGARHQTFLNLKAFLEESGKKLLFATNSGIYAEDYTPLGLHVENGEILRRLNKSKGGKGNFSMKPNGVFFIDNGKAKILETSEYEAQEATPDLAVQSGPLLLRKGEIHPKFNEGSDSVYVRNGVGVDPEGKVVFAISQKPVNLFTFASYFRDRLGCKDALYLDGALSGMYAPCLGREDIGFNYVGILAVVEDASPD
ncbi:MAG: phosphodiester glycosidase family protein [Candidatus Omnitrophica bacterium]|nr:phosphodiester glycosidase family protein [Candidatus Omnitrophota bacterium]